MKAILLICLLMGMGLQVTVTDSAKCTACTDFKSQQDCENTNNALGCTWKNSACTTTTPEVFQGYCQTIKDPANKCAKTFGCAYVDSKCIHFTGCTAYVKITLTECQTISSQCITNGVTCDTVKPCKEYTKDVCETNPSPLSPYKCKLDGDTCRDMKCTDADNTLITDTACDAWLDGCVTTGYGCIDVLPNCSQYTGTSDICNKMIGRDGNCTQDSTSTSTPSTPQACKLRVCSEAALTTWNSTSCTAYRAGCKATGFSCVDTLAACSFYTGTATTCLNFIGSDGKCAADAAATTCRPRKCEDKVSSVLTDCTTYLDGCKTNGVTCITTLGNCSTYKGTITTCAKIVGADGNCKGTSATDVTVSCALKTCADDDLGTETTDDECSKVQSTCKTTGKGCVATLLSCTTYTDDGNCLKYIGSEGKCKAGDGGATPKCAARQCTDNTTATTNEDCQNYLSGCVTFGAGCVAEANCTDTVSKLTCQGTTNNFTCGWTESCVPKDCTQFSQSLCSNTKLSDSQPCIWKSTQCFNAQCSDYTEIDDIKCDAHIKGCVTNGIKCADPTLCSQFQGNMTTCRAFIKAKCTNTDDTVAETTPCMAKSCSDNNIPASQDSDCDTYLTGCLFAGTNKCILNTSDCTGYAGGSTDACKVFTGYVSATEPRAPCWWSIGANCTTKVCSLASGMINDTNCGNFLTGCVYDGNVSCLDPSSDCTSFKYASNANDCQNLKGVNGTQKCYDGTSNACKVRECTDAPNTSDYDSDSKCETFLSGCFTKGQGCVLPTENCTIFSGSASKCAGYKGNSIPCLRTKSCIAPTLSCSGKTDATSNNQCMAYKSSCVLTFGSQTCQDSKTNCTDYTLSGSDNTAKSTFCNSVKTNGRLKCTYDPTITDKCSPLDCHLWSVALGGICTTFTTSDSCTIGLNQQCFKLGDCNTYTATGSTAALKKTFCNNQWSTNGGQCTYDGTSATCKAITTCEEVISPANQDDCYDQSGQSNCVFINSACVTIKTACTGYDISGISEAADKTTLCSSLKSKNGSVFTLCKYDAGTTATCVNAACEDISSPTQQSDCSIVSSTNCHYYSSKCYTIKDCALYQTPGTNVALQFCQNMYNTGGTEFCSYASGTPAICGVPKSCSEYSGLTPATGNPTLSFCNSKRDKTGVVCTYVDNATACSAPTTDAAKCTLIAVAATNVICDTKTIPLFCRSDGTGCIQSGTCASTAGTSLTVCQAIRDTSGFYCTWTTGTNCEAGKDSCTGWTGSQASDCTDKKDKYGNTCEWVSGSTCSNATTCEDAVSPKSQADCDLISSGCFFIYGACVSSTLGACNTYTIPTIAQTDADTKLEYCQGRVSNAGAVCTFSSGTTCTAAAACSTYTAAGTSVSEKLTYCQKLLTTDNYDCTYSSGAKCMVVADFCTSYTVGTASDCTSLKDTLGRSCVGTSTTCSYPACKDISSPESQVDCDMKAPGCTYSNSKCILLGSCLSYSTGGSGAIAFCNTQKEVSGNFCNATADTDANCTNRLCKDTAAQYFTTHKECQDYSSTCKSDGIGCVPKIKPCTDFNNDSSQFSWFLDTNGMSACVADTPDTDTKSCAATTCEMNVSAASQTDCDNYISKGGCRWKNPGCYSKSVPCSQYRGTLTECQSFIGNSIPCYSDQVARGACRDRTCADLKTATGDNDCSTFLTDCVYNGKGGCIDKSSNCTQFFGTSTTCVNLKGQSGSQLCWSSSTTQAACQVRSCTQLAGTSDPDCEAFMPNTHCITNGTTCVVGPKTCSQFSGNDSTCGQFTASNGPCKSSSKSSISAPCAPRVCYEAPNTFTTDDQCKTYHPTCVTNGKGCQSSISCGDYQNSTACAANTTCLWTFSCRMAYTTCSSFTSQGQSVCVNNPAKKCVWYYGSGTGACKEYTCADYDATFTTHDACQKVSNNQCTTTGAGCVNYGICSSYASASICAAAMTTETIKKCIWDQTRCRQQQCTDLKGATDDECNTKLSGCKTNGTNCIGPTYSCSDFNGSQKYCLINSEGQPCLYVDGICYPYDNCTDITSPSRTTCDAFSSNCVQGTSTCIALNQCSKYTDQVSCYSGINQSICGWTLESKCAEFKSCSDVKGTTWPDCAAWNSSCVSDGTNCVQIDACTSYLKQQSCDNNYDTAQNACFWNETACKYKQCSDVTATTDADCVKNIVKEGPCTTDGTKCVVRANCTNYKEKPACTVGSDGIPCFFGYAVGQTTGTQSCRAQECTDITGTTNDACVGKINKKPCVSNGQTCVAQGTCASYKNKLSCAAGGSDNSQCVFTAAPTATDPLAGTCVAFTSCASANGDKNTCTTNKSCKYTDATNKCETTDCATFNGTGKCNPFPSFDGKTFTLCVSSTSSCTEGDPSGIAQADCWATTRYTYTWNASTNKCSSCKASSSGNNSSGGNVTNDQTNTDSGYVLRASVVLALLGFMV